MKNRLINTSVFFQTCLLLLSFTNIGAQQFTAMAGSNFNNLATSKNSLKIGNKATPTVIIFTAVKAYQKNANINVGWEVDNEMNIRQYEIEKSLDGSIFTAVKILAATGNNNSSVNYNWFDEHPVSGINYYRIKSVEQTGAIKYSYAIIISTNNKTADINVYPNIITDNVVNVQFSSQPPGNYHVNLFNSNGILVYTKEIAVSSYNVAQSLLLPDTFTKGTYELKTISADDIETVQKIIIQ
jgi:hypothetical protein